MKVYKCEKCGNICLLLTGEKCCGADMTELTPEHDRRRSRKTCPRH
jgi:hypothetical protein